MYPENIYKRLNNLQASKIDTQTSRSQQNNNPITVTASFILAAMHAGNSQSLIISTMWKVKKISKPIAIN